MLWFVITTIIVFAAKAAHLPLCDYDGDTFGRWVSLVGYETNNPLQQEVAEKYVLGGPREALNFSRVWLPHNCSIHRFTKSSVHDVLERMIRTQEMQPPYRMIVMADSGMRGILCGVMRILSGSEIYGPNLNAICGTEDTEPMSLAQYHGLNNVHFGDNLEISFMYIKSLRVQYTQWMLEGNMNKAPNVLVVNTGAWDFDHVSRLRMGEVADLNCSDQAMDWASENRVQPGVRQAMLECGGIAKALKVRAIYRSNHYNERFGVNCADDRVHEMLKDLNWEWWDNSRVSADVWRSQVWDGFHFERQNDHTVADHVAHREAELAQGKETPGMLEMQLAQSLLHRLFRDVLQQMLDERKGRLSRRRML
jgi:hypothetical protein